MKTLLLSCIALGINTACYASEPVTETEFLKDSLDKVNLAIVQGESAKERASLLVCRGMIENGLGDRDKAELDFSTAIKEDPTLAPCVETLRKN